MFKWICKIFCTKYYSSAIKKNSDSVRVDDIEHSIYKFVQHYTGTYLLPPFKRDKLTTETVIHIDLLLDDLEVTNLMDDFFETFHVARNNFNIETYYHSPTGSLFFGLGKNSVPEPNYDMKLTIGMLIESAKVGHWLYH